MKGITFAIFCLIIILSIHSSPAQESTGIPYGLYNGGGTTQWGFRWFTDTTAQTGAVEIKKPGSPDKLRTESANSRLIQQKGKDPVYYHHLRVNDLESYTKYQFRVGKEGGWSEWLTFETASLAEMFLPAPVPDRIALSWTEDPATSFAITWRTDTSIQESKAQIAIAVDAPKYDQGQWGFPDTSEKTAISERLDWKGLASHHHSAHFTSLKPETTYAYRVGDGRRWSEWFHYTTASEEAKPFSFIYFGDAQNELKAFWSRTIRQAYADKPEAKFIVHAGDLINSPGSNQEWGEWFYAGSFIHSTLPIIATPGNHEYTRDDLNQPLLDPYWQKHFTLPNNGPQGRNLSEATYYLDYQGVRIVSLNSMEIEGRDSTAYKIQLEWLEKVLSENPSQWTIMTFHYPVYGAARSNSKRLKEHFAPLFEKYKVDLVLQGHDHVYARGTYKNQPAGKRKRPNNVGPVYVVSVSGPKMYSISHKKDWMDRVAEGTQLYQILHVEESKIRYEAYTTTGKLYDAFELHKQGNDRPNKLVNHIPDTPERFEEKAEEGASN